ncbi:hypothetical protein NCAS_0B02640 [Naumovozyma castellii]|uniref:Riboflavin kinase n=1 Tax=Naumovozyma castellii TaxID=27288 RepID=G0VBM2_NAUCA|nr:hypothetical protein NCAS_0B02640 [Naumovozyma castellii CBS 4309]CCC68348.1 hypothetical protein NCAS_0B02640 [Naumovozyma castellii CBS 4309]
MGGRPFDVPIPEEPKAPFPIITEYCDIVCGFGRGSTDLGIPTANVEIEEVPPRMNLLDLGVYFGFAHLEKVDKELTHVNRKDGQKVAYNYGSHLTEENGDLDILPMVLSIGRNPFYGNDFKTIELHILHDFTDNFYGAKVKFNILGHIRQELDYTTKEALIRDINIDIEIARSTLLKKSYLKYKEELRC